MWNDGDIFGALLFGLLFGLVVGVVFMGITSPTPVDHYPGLRDRLIEQQEDCESRPGVISCEWSEDKVDYVPKDAAR